MNAPRTAVGPIKAVIFDMDGLLLDTEGIYTEVTQIIAERYGRTYDWGIKQHIIGRGAQDLADYVVKALDLPITPAEFLEIREPLMSERFPKALGMPGAEALVRHLKAHNIPIAVGTSSSRNSFGHKTTLHREWFGLFDTIVTADDPEGGPRQAGAGHLPHRCTPPGRCARGLPGVRRLAVWCDGGEGRPYDRHRRAR
jgi:Predicted phosphatase/phosphohexomutase